MSDDAELLRRYVKDRSESDFTELVGRYLSLVYHAALRRSGGRFDVAQEVTQEVFIRLAKQAAKLVNHPVLAGWLYLTTRHAANEILRAERRRQAREQEAHMLNSLNDPGSTSPSWEQLQRELDGAMDQLAERDREALLLRFFHHQAFLQIGESFGLSEDAARKRVERALERLRARLVKRGITSTAAALGVVLSANVATAVPSTLGPTIAAAALAHATASVLPTAGLLHFMSTKLTLHGLAAVGVAVVLGISSLGLALHENREKQHARAEWEAARRANDEASAHLRALAQQDRDTDQWVNKLQADVEKVRASLAANSGQSAPAAATANRNAPLTQSEREDFFARYGQARTMLLELGEAQIAANLAPFFKTVNLTPEQISELKRRTAQLWLDHASITPTSMTPTVLQLPDADLREILGDENFERYQAFNLVAPAYGVAEWVRLAVGYTATPLSDAQANQLTQTVIDHSNAAQKTGTKLDLNSVDWNAVLAGAQGSLTPAQFQAAQPFLLSKQLGQATARAQKDYVASQKPKS